MEPADFQLSSAVFCALQQHSLAEKRKRLHLIRSSRHYLLRLLDKAFSCLRREKYVHRLRLLFRHLAAAPKERELREEQLAISFLFRSVRGCLLKLCRVTAAIKTARKCNQIALDFNHKRLQSNFFVLWFQVCQWQPLVRKSRQKMLANLQRQCFREWRAAADREKAEQRLMAQAEQAHRHSLLQRAYASLYQNIGLQFSVLFNRHLVHECFSHWVTFVLEESTKLRLAAELHLRKQITAKAFGGLELHCKFSKLSRSLRRRNLTEAVGRLFQYCSLRSEARQNRQLSAKHIKSNKILGWTHRRVISACFSAWIELFEARRQGALRVQQFTQGRDSALKGKTFEKLRVNVQLNLSTKYDALKTYHKCFRAIISARPRNSEVAEFKRRADRERLRVLFCALREWAMCSGPSAHYNARLVRRVFSQLFRTVVETYLRQKRECEEYNRYVLTSRCYKAWRRKWQRRERLRRTLAQLQLHCRTAAQPAVASGFNAIAWTAEIDRRIRLKQYSLKWQVFIGWKLFHSSHKDLSL